MSGNIRKTQNTIRFQLKLIELAIDNDWNYHDRCFLKYRRYYLLRRLLELQIKEFNNGN